MASASASAPGTAVEASSGAAAVLVYVEVLAAYRKQCEADGRYDEADCAHQKLKQIVRDEEEVRGGLEIDYWNDMATLLSSFS